MAIEIGVKLDVGVEVPIGAVVKPSVSFLPDLFVVDDNDVWTGKVERRVGMNFMLYPSKQAYIDSKGKDVLLSVKNFPSGWTKSLTQAEFDSLTSGNALLIVEGWAKDYIESFIGADTCTIYDPYA